MALLDNLAPGILLRGIRPQATVTIVAVMRHGADSAEIVYKDAAGGLGTQLLYRADAEQLEIVPAELPWSFTADGAAFRLVSEAYRIRLAYLFDPFIAVHTSLVEPLPHQITAVYETMLKKQPLRYLLADDPGAGKTIMAGLLIKELMVRGDLRRCLIVAPGNLVEQWQDEMLRRFHLTFEILTNDRLEASASGNALQEMPLCIARLDKLARNEEVQGHLKQTEWDLVVVDEAHKMSATFFSSEEIKYTRRYRLGEILGRIGRHLLMLSATPHNGKEEDFQLFLRLLDADRFEGRFRDGVHRVDVSDLMRHLVKEPAPLLLVLADPRTSWPGPPSPLSRRAARNRAAPSARLSFTGISSNLAPSIKRQYQPSLTSGKSPVRDRSSRSFATVSSLTWSRSAISRVRERWPGFRQKSNWRCSNRSLMTYPSECAMIFFLPPAHQDKQRFRRIRGNFAQPLQRRKDTGRSSLCLLYV
jgi:hypothetical protein